MKALDEVIYTTETHDRNTVRGSIGKPIRVNKPNRQLELHPTISTLTLTADASLFSRHCRAMAKNESSSAGNLNPEKYPKARAKKIFEK